MFWIGLTGGLGSGKSTVTQYLRSQGFTVVDADELAQAVLLPKSPGYKKVIDEFGTEILNLDQSINRSLLAQRVFGNSAELKKLEAIIHPLVQSRVQELKSKAKESGDFWAFYDVPLLFEKNLESQFDAVILVAATEENQRMRVKKRNNWSEAEIDLRLGAQIPLLKKVTRTPFVIENNGTQAELQSSVNETLKKLKDQLCTKST